MISEINDKIISAPVRWAGSKKAIIKPLLCTFSEGHKNYVEAFLGSGVVLLNVLNNNEQFKYEDFYVNDANEAIISFYKRLKREPKLFVEELSNLTSEYNTLNSLEEKSEFYYVTRDAFNSNSGDKSAQFYLLMKAGFNGVYRENSKGEFNVPFGKKERIDCNEDNLYRISKLIKRVHFYNKNYPDFIRVLVSKNITDDAFMYFDPPYIPDDDSVYKNQTLYLKPLFNHELFFDEVSSIASNKCKMIISMSDSKIANQIYNNNPFHKMILGETYRVVNPQRKMYSREVIFTNI